ncbi:MAG: dTMP kinase [Planctomycetota bacterium]
MNDYANTLAGRFLVIDGPDGAGKSTQTALLADALGKGGLTVRQVRDPGGTAIGDRIREILLDPSCDEMAVRTELMLYMASRAQLVAEIVRPALQAGECVLSDRYISSTIAYQSAGGADVDEVRTVGDIAVGSLWPDLTIILDLPSDEGLTRAAKRSDPDRMEAKAREFHRRVRELFLAQAKQDPARCVVVDASGEPADVHQRVVKTVRRFVKKSAP